MQLHTRSFFSIIGTLFVLSGLMLISGCYYDNEEDLYPPDLSGCDTTAVSYAADIAPVLSAQCYSCHGAGNVSGGVNLETHAGVQTAAFNQNLFCSINWDNGCAQMPQGGSKLPACTINKFKAWIDQGAQNN